MSVIVNIKGTPIDFPSSGESPNWAPAVVEFAQAVENALVTAISDFDVPATVIEITSDNITFPTATTVNINELNFSIAIIRSFTVTYSIILNKTLGGSVSESGTITAYYDSNNIPKWTFTRDYVGEANVDFNVTDAGQVTFAVNEPSSNFYSSGKLSFFAKTLEQA